MIELTTCAERGRDLTITPDGPRGPRYEVQDGVIAAAQLTGLPIVPMSYHLNWKIRLNSWDGFQIPLPFARCDVVIAKPIVVPREISDDDREALRKQLERFVDFTGPHGALVRDNSDWLGPLVLVDFLRDVGKHFSVNVMLALEDAFDVEFPQQMLRKSTFESVASIKEALVELTSRASA